MFFRQYNCEWNITAANPDARILVNFHFVDIDADSATNKCYDKVTIYEGSNTLCLLKLNCTNTLQVNTILKLNRVKARHLLRLIFLLFADSSCEPRKESENT